MNINGSKARYEDDALDNMVFDLYLLFFNIIGSFRSFLGMKLSLRILSCSFTLSHVGV